MRAAVLLAEFVLRQRERLCSHGHRLHVLLERFGLLEDVLSGVLVGHLGLAEIAARVIVDAFRLVLSCTCFGDVLDGLAGSVALLLGVSCVPRVSSARGAGRRLPSAVSGFVLRTERWSGVRRARARAPEQQDRAQRRTRSTTSLVALATTGCSSALPKVLAVTAALCTWTRKVSALLS